jgi:hypothetical protein
MGKNVWLRWTNLVLPLIQSGGGKFLPAFFFIERLGHLNSDIELAALQSQIKSCSRFLHKLQRNLS